MDTYNMLLEILPKEYIYIDEPMSKHTTFKIGGLADYFVTPTKSEQIKKIIVISKQNNIPLTVIGNGSNVLVVYYSAQGHTESVAEQIAENLNADLFEIVPVDEYTSDDLNWTDSDSRVSLEHDDESLRDVELVSTTVDNWDSYDTVIIGYPIWWGIAAWPVNTFVKANDFSGKTVIPFCTSSSSGLGQSGDLLAELAGTGDWQDGQRFRSNPSDADIKSFTDSLAN